MPRWGDFPLHLGIIVVWQETVARRVNYDLCSRDCSDSSSLVRKIETEKARGDPRSSGDNRATHWLRCVVPPRSCTMLKPIDLPHPNPSGLCIRRGGEEFVFACPRPECSPSQWGLPRWWRLLASEPAFLLTITPVSSPTQGPLPPGAMESTRRAPVSLSGLPLFVGVFSARIQDEPQS